MSSIACDALQPAYLTFSLPLDPARLLRARHRIHDYLDQHGASEDVVDSVVLAIEEAMTNAVRHSGAAENLIVHLHFEGRDLFAEVRDRGKGFDVDSFDRDRTPDPLSPDGRGLFLIFRLMDEVELACDGGLSVCMRKGDAIAQLAVGQSAESGIADARILTQGGYREQRSRLLVQELDEGFASLDWEYRFRFANQAALDLYRMRPDDVLGRSIWELFPHIGATPPGTALREAMELGLSSIVEFHSQALGRWIEVRAYPTSSGATIYLRDIDERRRKELERDEFFEALRESEERFRELFYNMTEGVVLHELLYAGDRAVDYRVVNVNPAFDRHTGLSGSELLGRLASEAYGTGEAPYLEEYARSVESGEAVSFETYFEPLDRHFRISAVPTLPGHFATIFEDVTPQKRTEQVLRRSERRYRELVQYAKSAIIRWSTDGTIVFLNEYAQELFGWSAEEAIGKSVDIFLPERDSTGADLTALARSIIEHPERYATNINENMCRDGRRLWMAWSNRAITGEDGTVREILAVGSDITDLKDAEDALRRSEEKHRVLFDSIDEGFFLIEVIFDQAGRPIDLRYLEANAAATAMLGRDYTGLRLTEIDPNYERYWFEIFGEVARTGRAAREERYAAPDKRWYDFHVFKVGGPESRLIGNTFRDVTERKQAEQMLRESRDRYQALIESTSDFIWEMDAQGKYTYCSPQMETLWGLKPQEMLGKSPLEVMPAEEREQAGPAFKQLFQTPQPFNGLESRAFDAQGRLIYLEISGVPFFDEEGRLLGFRGVTRDVTERMRAGEQLRGSDARFQMMTDGLPTVVWVHDAEGRLQFVNRAYLEFFGVSEEEVLGPNWIPLVHSDDKEHYVGEFMAALRERRNYECEARVMAAGGQWRWVHSRGAPYYSDTGEFLGMVGSSPDITDRKRAEDELQQLYGEQRRIARTLQANLLHPLPTVPGLDLAALSLPAGREELIGGDFHDVFQLSDGLVIALIGDVVGKGIPAAGLTETVRSAVRALASITPRPGFILHQINRMLLAEAHHEHLITVLVAMLDPETGQAFFSSAGHPPPVRLGDQGAELIESSDYGPPLGGLRTCLRRNSLRA